VAVQNDVDGRLRQEKKPLTPPLRKHGDETEGNTIERSPRVVKLTRNRISRARET